MILENLIKWCARPFSFCLSSRISERFTSKVSKMKRICYTELQRPKIGFLDNSAKILGNVHLHDPKRISIGAKTIINRHCILSTWNNDELSMGGVII